jgi:NADPH2:quinone reductase
VHRARLREGETVLVTAAAGGVGLATVQVAKALGTRVIALAGGDAKLEVVRKAGADVAIDYKKEDWVDRVKQETSGRGADVIIENVGGEVFDGCTRCVAWDGRLVVVGFAGGKIPEIKANRILLKHIAVIGLFFGMMVQHAPEQVAETYRALFELVQAGKIKPLVWKTYPLERAGEALEALGSRRSWGKIAVAP